MSSHQTGKITPGHVGIFSSFLILGFLFLDAPRITCQVQHVVPHRMQTAPTTPFPLVEAKEAQEFDLLPKAEQIAKLAKDGPMFPAQYNLSNFSTRVLIKGNSSLFIDYALEPNSVALLKLSGDASDLTITLTPSDTFSNEILRVVEGMPRLRKSMPGSGFSHKPPQGFWSNPKKVEDG